jgi:hypothetical protein
MSNVILPTAYFPPISWWVIALNNTTILIEDHETYPKQTYRNRCTIYSANGLMQLNIPVKKVNGNHTGISEIEIDNSRNWKKIHWRTLESAYSKTPYFLYYRDIVEDCYEKDFILLKDFNLQTIKACIQLLKARDIGIEMTRAYTHGKQMPEYRELIHPKVHYSHLGIKNFPRYMQAFETRHGFIENLSITDLLFNLGPDSLEYLRSISALNFSEPFATLPGIQP